MNITCKPRCDPPHPHPVITPTILALPASPDVTPLTPIQSSPPPYLLHFSFPLHSVVFFRICWTKCLPFF
ncbi:hypothetical protein LDENG_00272820 [Lucifuga dentata]|nr:hypothetical protein LDENG_00272820 [Lucifuga dentata]